MRSKKDIAEWVRGFREAILDEMPWAAENEAALATYVLAAINAEASEDLQEVINELDVQRGS